MCEVPCSQGGRRGAPWQPTPLQSCCPSPSVDSIMLVEEGFSVTSVDASDKMLKYALKERWTRRREPAFDKWGMSVPPGKALHPGCLLWPEPHYCHFPEGNLGLNRGTRDQEPNLIFSSRA